MPARESEKPPTTPSAKRPLCCWCKKPINGLVYYQGGLQSHPSHRRCLVIIKRSRDGGI